MSWDALIMNGTGVPKSLSDVRKDWEPPSLGDPDDIRAQLSEMLPQIEWVPDRDYGSLETDKFAIEFRVPEEQPLRAVTVRVVGNGDPISVLVDLCRTKNWVIFDNQVGDLMDLGAKQSDSWQQFKEWRDRTS